MSARNLALSFCALCLCLALSGCRTMQPTSWSATNLAPDNRILIGRYGGTQLARPGVSSEGKKHGGTKELHRNKGEDPGGSASLLLLPKDENRVLVADRGALGESFLP